MFGRKMLMRQEQKQKTVCRCPALEDIFAKTQKSIDGVIPGQNILNHSLLTGLISRYLISLYPSSIRRKVFPKGTEIVVSFHDIGKISPVFIAKLLSNVTSNIPYWYEEVKKYQDFEHDSKFRHEVISGEFFSSKSWAISRIVGQHHGKYVPGAGLPISCDVYGGEEWNIRRHELETKLCETFGSSEMNLEELYNSFNSISSAQLSAISGLTTISDWLASSDLFCTTNVSDSEVMVSQKLEELGFKDLEINKNISFETMFGFKPNVIQQEFIDIIEPGGVFVLEAPMGIGKTEAALYAAYRVLSSDHATGIYFALPTQITSEKIYERFTAFIDKFVNLNNFACKLLHSKSKYYELNNKGNNEDFFWFNSSKRGLLVRFAVGTIDQALMSILNVKHGFIRDFGLAGKVVILDEIHTYDCFTQVFVSEMIKRLRELQCTVIILSATLRKNERFRLLNFNNSEDNRLIDGYPVLSWVKAQECAIHQKVITNHLIQKKNILLSFRTIEDCFAEAVKRASEGQQVLWIENTVKNAQSVYESISSIVSQKSAVIEIGLIHSKFTKSDRLKLEGKWLNILGKSATNSERLLKGRILVGTQILEQSIDIDADFLISRIAPSDMILQRMGRLWRHNRVRKDNTKCETWIIDVNLFDSLVAPMDENNFGKSVYVYEPYVLNRSVEALKLFQNIRLPEDVPTIIDSTYRMRTEDSYWVDLRKQMEHGTGYKKGNIQLNQKAISMLSNDGVISSAVDDVCTRYSEEDNLPIIILRNYSIDDSRVMLYFLDGTSLVIDKDENDYENIKNIILAIENNSVSCPVRKLPCRITYSDAKRIGLPRYVCLGGRHDSVIDFAIMLYGEDGRLSNLNNCAEDNYEYYYTEYKGLEIRRLN